MKKSKTPMQRRFRGLLPIVVDIETSGVNPATDAMLEIAMVTLVMGDDGEIRPDKTIAYHVEPFPGARMDPKALEITGIDPYSALRLAIPEKQALERIFAQVNQELEAAGCYRAVLVGHNAWFDLNFILEAVKRCEIRHLPFHAFTTFDTASLSAVALGETVLARAARRAKIYFNIKEAHSAIYDAERTAELFCYLVNRNKL